MKRLEPAGEKLTEPAEEPGVKFENLIHFANSRWRLGQPKSSAQQLSSAALRQGWRVFYCAPESATPGIGSRRRNLRLLHPLGPIDPQAIQQSLADWEVYPGNTLVMTSYASPSAARLLGHFAGQGSCSLTLAGFWNVVHHHAAQGNQVAEHLQGGFPADGAGQGQGGAHPLD